MSYYAKGNGSIVFARKLTDKEFKEIKYVLVEVLEFDGTPCEDKFKWAIGKGYFVVWHPENNYHEDEIIRTLNELKAIAPIESGCIDFTGEDDTYWRFIFKDDEWIEQNGRIVYDEDEPETFGTVTWCRDDIITALEQMDVAVSEELIDRIFAECDNDHHFTDRMIEAGWDTLYRYIEDDIRTEKFWAEREMKALRTRNGGPEESVEPKNPDDDAPGDVCWDSYIDAIEDMNE